MKIAGLVLCAPGARTGEVPVEHGVGVRLVETLTGPDAEPFFPTPPPARADVWRGQEGPKETEAFEGVLFAGLVLAFVRVLYPRVRWALDAARPERFLYGFVGKLLVAVVSEVRA